MNLNITDSGRLSGQQALRIHPMWSVKNVWFCGCACMCQQLGVFLISSSYKIHLCAMYAWNLEIILCHKWFCFVLFCFFLKMFTWGYLTLQDSQPIMHILISWEIELFYVTWLIQAESLSGQGGHESWTGQKLLVCKPFKSFLSLPHLMSIKW